MDTENIKNSWFFKTVTHISIDNMLHIRDSVTMPDVNKYSLRSILSCYFSISSHALFVIHIHSNLTLLSNNLLRVLWFVKKTQFTLQMI